MDRKNSERRKGLMGYEKRFHDALTIKNLLIFIINLQL